MELIKAKKVEVYKILPPSVIKKMKTGLKVFPKRAKTNMTPYRNKKGVYRIFEGRKLVYVGSSTTDLYETIMRHFQKWNDSAYKKRITYQNKLHKVKYYVQVTLMNDDDEVWKMERALVCKHKPRDNQHKYEMFCKHPEYNKLNTSFESEKEVVPDDNWKFENPFA